jgi:hypothetical protein
MRNDEPFDPFDSQNLAALPERALTKRVLTKLRVLVG